MLPQPPPAPPLDPRYPFGSIRISSLVAALVKLDIKVPIEELLKAIQDEARRANLAAEAAQHNIDPAHRRTAMSKCQPTANSLPAL